MDRLVDHLFVFEGEGVIRDFPGNYTDYREVAAEEEAKRIADAKKANAVSNSSPKTATVQTQNQTQIQTQIVEKPKTKVSFKEKQEYEKLEKEIAELETEKVVLTEKLSGGISNYSEIATISKRIEEISIAVDTKSMRWLELAEMM
jgi:ATP-binding cassette subfamily F protein uup